ncbi:MAG TPA: PIN domain-containing protein [Solidesulfovibrio magneticus]|jgi:predicted nucleic acid-binding protein|nr:PIN domain-containing protein [Solidesulfovibrio magneticus]
MKVFFDTSVLVAAMVKSHPMHQRAFPWYLKSRRGEIEMAVAAHGLAETYACLTTYPSRPRISPVAAMALLRESIVRTSTVVSLDGRDYLEALDMVSDKGRGGGSVYDALHVIAAEKNGADLVLSFNRKHFEPLLRPGQRFIEP